MRPTLLMVIACTALIGADLLVSRAFGRSVQTGELLATAFAALAVRFSPARTARRRAEGR